MSYPTWDAYFMDFAKTAGRNSKCLSRQIGAVLVRNRIVVTTGYNGPPRGVKHCGHDTKPGYARVCPRRCKGYRSAEGLGICPAAHAEINAIANAASVGVSTLGISLYCDCGPPCKDCLKYLINAGVGEIVYNPDNTTGNIGIYYDELSKRLVDESSIRIRKAIMVPYGGRTGESEA